MDLLNVKLQITTLPHRPYCGNNCMYIRAFRMHTHTGNVITCTKGFLSVNFATSSLRLGSYVHSTPEVIIQAHKSRAEIEEA